jgi:hypothetical protein
MDDVCLHGGKTEGWIDLRVRICAWSLKTPTAFMQGESKINPTRNRKKNRQTDLMKIGFIRAEILLLIEQPEQIETGKKRNYPIKSTGEDIRSRLYGKENNFRRRYWIG